MIEYAIFRVERGLDCDQDDGMKMYKLVDVMPPTLEPLELHGPISEAEVTFMFDSLRERRREQLPKLCKISMQRDVDRDQNIKKHPHPHH